MLLVLGNFNARVGNNAVTWQGIIGRFRPGGYNENGVLLMDYCALNGLVVTNQLFQHCSCHQYTWFHPAESAQTGIGHVLEYVLVVHGPALERNRGNKYIPAWMPLALHCPCLSWASYLGGGLRLLQSPHTLAQCSTPHFFGLVPVSACLLKVICTG